LSLREAIGFADNDRSGNATISFDPAVFAQAQAINLTGGQLELSNTSEAETLTGPAAGVTVNGGGLSRVVGSSEARATTSSASATAAAASPTPTWGSGRNRAKTYGKNRLGGAFIVDFPPQVAV
jgi:hypothetical protein